MPISGLPEAQGEQGEEGGIVAEINVTPLTDVFLVLLIIFMVTTTIVQNEGKNIELPSAAESTETPTGVTVSVDVEGRIQVNDRVVTREELGPALVDALERAQQKVVILRGDRRLLLGEVVGILDLAQTAGAEAVAIATESETGS